MKVCVWRSTTTQQASPIVAGDVVQGNPTIGVGRLLTDDRGITEDEVMMLLLKNDLAWVAKKAGLMDFGPAR